MRLQEGMSRSGAPPRAPWGRSSPPGDVTLAPAPRPGGPLLPALASFCSQGCPGEGVLGCPLARALHLLPLGIWGCVGPGGLGPHRLFKCVQGLMQRSQEETVGEAHGAGGAGPLGGSWQQAATPPSCQ